MCDAHMFGRFDVVEVLDRRWILDVAHNEGGAQFLLDRISRSDYEVSAVMCGMLMDKHHCEFVERLNSGLNKSGPYSRKEAPWLFLSTQGERSYSGAELCASASNVVHGRIPKDMEQGIAEVLSLTDSQDVILCVGSFNLIEQFYNHVLP